MKILKKIWSILKELNKLIFGFDIDDEIKYENMLEDNNHSNIIIMSDYDYINAETVKPEIGILEPQGLKIIKKPIDDYIQTSTKKIEELLSFFEEV